MAAPVINKMFGGVVPGGVLTVTSGTPVQVTANLVLSTGNSSAGNTKTAPYAVTCRQIGISVDAAAGGSVYVNYGNFAGKGNQTALIIQPGTTQALPVNSRCTEGEIDASKWYIDVATGSASVAINFVDASN